MSRSLYSFAQKFVNEQLDAEQFADSFILRWKEERDSGELLTDPADLSECLSSVFCVADLYNSEMDRFEYELSEPQLRNEVRKLPAGVKC